jgi:hypothetical protein
MPSFQSFSLLAALPLFCAVAPVESALTRTSAAQTPRVTCKAGVTIERTLTMSGSRELTSVVNHVAGEEHAGQDRISTRMMQKQVVLDEIKGCADGRPTQLARTYVTLEKGRTDTRSAGGEERTSERPEESGLEGKTVLFTWREDEKRHVATIDAEPAPELTQDLVCDMDYRVLLPEGDVAAGEKWEVDFADAKQALQRPGGDIPFQAVAEAGSMDRRLRAKAWQSTGGKLSCELGAVREVDGRKLVTIRFEGKMSFDAAVEREAEEKGPKELRVASAQDLGGELVWDLGEGRATKVDWSSKGAITITMDATTRQPDGIAVDFQQVMTFDEAYEYAGRFTAK